jgi:hypothetical protein
MLFQSNPRPSRCPLGYTVPKKQADAPILHPLLPAPFSRTSPPPPKPLALPPCPHLAILPPEAGSGAAEPNG